MYCIHVYMYCIHVYMYQLSQFVSPFSGRQFVGVPGTSGASPWKRQDSKENHRHNETIHRHCHIIREGSSPFQKYLTN